MKARFVYFTLLISSLSFAQGGFKKGSKGNDYIVVTNKGIQFAFGPTYLMPSKPIERDDFKIKAAGKVGFFAEFGMVNFPKWKGIPIGFLKKSRIMDYMDWGVGYRQYAGAESTDFRPNNQSIGKGDFQNGYLFGRFSAHTLIFYGKKKIDKVRKHFIDQSLGFNLDYNLFPGDTLYQDNFTQYKADLAFQKPLMFQMHYSLGIGIRLNRAWMIIPGAQIPLIGIHQWNGFNARMNWFSSQYWPVQLQLKFIKLFERPPKCGAYGDPRDAEFDKKFRMGN